MVDPNHHTVRSAATKKLTIKNIQHYIIIIFIYVQSHALVYSESIAVTIISTCLNDFSIKLL